MQRVSIDDPRPIFLFRFYVEVDKHGKDLIGYQNKQRAAYRLTYDNNGEAWRFTSNYQVITVVQMERHPKLAGRIFTIRPAELKTVLLKFNDMQAGGDRGGRGADGRGAAGGGVDGGGADGGGEAALGRGRGRGDHGGDADAAAGGRGRGRGTGAAGQATRWDSRRVQPAPEGALDAAGAAAAADARCAAESNSRAERMERRAAVHPERQ